MSLLSFSSLRKMVTPPDLAIDLGTANTRLYARGRGLIVDEPTLIKLEPTSNLGFGQDARQKTAAVLVKTVRRHGCP